MIKHTREKQVKIVATGLALCMLAAPLSASAAESSVLMASGGVASVLETRWVCVNGDSNRKDRS